MAYSATYVMFSPWLDAAYIDDVKIEVIIPKIFAPKNLSFDNYTGTGFSGSLGGRGEGNGLSAERIYQKQRRLARLLS